MKKHNETLLSKYGIIAFAEIVIFITVFLVITTSLTKKPVESIYSQSLESILDLSADIAETWFADKVEALKLYQRSVVESTDNREHIKSAIKNKVKPSGFEYVMVFWDDATGAKDGDPETYNTKGGISTVGILNREYWINHKSSDVDVWLESPRQSNAGGFNMPLFVRSNFLDDATGELVHGGMVGFVELEPIHTLAKQFYTTGTVAIYDDAGSLRAGDDLLGLQDASNEKKINPEDYIIIQKTCTLANKTWTVAAGVTKAEAARITSDLRRNSVIGGLMVAVALLVCVLAIIRIVISKFDDIKKNVDNLNSGDKDLTKRIPIYHNNEISHVKASVNEFVNTVHETVLGIGNANLNLKNSFDHVKECLDETKGHIDDIAVEIEKASDTLASEDSSVTDTSNFVTEISGSISRLNDMIEKQAASISQAGSSIEQMIGNIRSVTESVEKMSSEFTALNEATEDGVKKNLVVNELLETVLMQSKSLQETNLIISSISSQTNLLSMNAMIESAHAGEAGKGFAVVAEEIRKLADTSAAQSKNINENLKSVAENINKVVESANSSKASFELVSLKAQNTSQLVQTIKGAMEEQNEGSKQVLEALEAMNKNSGDVQTSSKEIENGAKEILSAIENLKTSSVNMSDNFNKIVSTTNATQQATVRLSQFATEMSGAVNDISKKINEFKI
ncbi:MAG: hypothetical protein IJ828_04310 [Treponema sp.]|nr:hypothetical protein [Treponema sp.]